MSRRFFRTNILRITTLALFAGAVYAIGQTIPHQVLTKGLAVMASAVWG